MKTIHCLIIAISFCYSMMSAQTTIITTSQLTKHEWLFIEKPSENLYEGYRFDDKNIYTFVDYDGRAEVSAPYYLSGTPDTVFDKSKVGKNKSGKYIIVDWETRLTVDSPWEHITVIYQVLDASDNSLLLAHPKKLSTQLRLTPCFKN